MITSRKISQVNVFAGSPWEVASVKNLLKAAYIEVSMKENGRNGFLLSVPCEYYTAAMRVIGNRKRAVLGMVSVLCDTAPTDRSLFSVFPLTRIFDICRIKVKRNSTPVEDTGGWQYANTVSHLCSRGRAARTVGPCADRAVRAAAAPVRQPLAEPGLACAGAGGSSAAAACAARCPRAGAARSAGPAARNGHRRRSDRKGPASG